MSTGVWSSSHAARAAKSDGDEDTAGKAGKCRGYQKKAIELNGNQPRENHDKPEETSAIVHRGSWTRKNKHDTTLESVGHSAR